MWISYAEVPLSPDELCYALGIELGSTDFYAGNIPSITTLVSCCQGLISVDKEASTVRLIHFTLREYISTHPDIFTRPHSTMAEICLTYLNSEQAKAIPANRYRDTQDTPFLKYSSIYWGVHAKRELTDYARLLALQFAQDSDGHVSWVLLFGEVGGLDIVDFDKGSPFSGLHGASFFGIAEVVAGLIEMECYDLNGEDCWGTTPLSWAAEKGHEEVVKILLGRDEVDPDKPDDDGRGPLWYAAWNGHEGVVKILLGQEGVDPDRLDHQGRAPLMTATIYGQKGVIELLQSHKAVARSAT